MYVECVRACVRVRVYTCTCMPAVLALSLQRRLCWRMPAPPQSLQMLLWQLCGQMLAPPQSL